MLAAVLVTIALLLGVNVVGGLIYLEIRAIDELSVRGGDPSREE